MKAMILAAGKGERLRPLTAKTPKPLLKVGGKALIEYHLEKMSVAGVNEVIINIAYLGEQIKTTLGDGSRYGLSIVYSEEPHPLETAGAIHHALPLLGEKPFLLVNGDVWTDMPYGPLLAYPCEQTQGHLVLVDNPAHNPEGDYSLENRFIGKKHQVSYTFSGISVLCPKLVAEFPNKREAFPLREVFAYWLQKCHLSGALYRGQWWDIGTPERLQALDNLLNH